MSAGSSIDYDALTQDALRGVVRAVLIQVAAGKSGLPGEHHFYIAFNTQAPGVVMSRRLKEKYPEEMMIVLQHRFWDLAVTEEAFEVKLTFDGIPERLYIPFQSMKVFFDPSVRFSLQFGENAADEAADGQGPRRRRPGEERAGGERRVRQRQRQRNDDAPDAAPDAAAPAPAAPQPSPPTVFTPRAVEPARTPASAKGEVPSAPPGQEAGPQADTSKPDGGAKVFTLDSFRKKK